MLYLTNKLSTIASAALAVASLAGVGPVPAAQDTGGGGKKACSIVARPKGGLSREDRRTVARYLAENAGDLPAAPEALVAQVFETKIWTALHDELAQPVPDHLDSQLSPPAEGMARVIFAGLLLVINTDTGEVVDIVRPRH